MKATTQQQSKRLLELGIDPNTAYMYYPHFGEGEDIPAWSFDVYDVYNKEPINAAFEMIVWLKENNLIYI